MQSGANSLNTEEEPAAIDELDLDPLDEIICSLLSQGWTYRQTANEAGCSTKTVQRRMADPLFAAEVRRRRKADMAATTARLVQLTRSATDRLAQLLSSDNEWVGLQAARTLLDIGHRRYQAEAQDDILERLSVLETTLAEQSRCDGSHE